MFTTLLHTAGDEVLKEEGLCPTPPTALAGRRA